MALSPTQRLKIGKREKAIVSHAFSFSPLSSLNSTQKGLRLRRRERMAYHEKRTPIGFSCVLSRLNCRPDWGLSCGARREGWKTSSPKNACVGGYFGLSTREKLLALRAWGDSFNFHGFGCLVLYAAVYTGVYCLRAQRFTPSDSLRASSPIWASKASLARTRERLSFGRRVAWRDNRDFRRKAQVENFSTELENEQIKTI